MQIITVDDSEFSDLLNAWKDSKCVGKFWRNGTMQIVCATNHFILISNGRNPERIALRPTRSLSDAEELALSMLMNEEASGNRVEYGEE